MMEAAFTKSVSAAEVSMPKISATWGTGLVHAGNHGVDRRGGPERRGRSDKKLRFGFDAEEDDDA